MFREMEKKEKKTYLAELQAVYLPPTLDHLNTNRGMEGVRGGIRNMLNLHCRRV